MSQYNDLTDFFIKDKEQLTSDALYKARTLVKIILWIWGVFTLMAIPQILGYFSEETTFYLVIFCPAILFLIKFTGNENLVSSLLIIGGTFATIYNINVTGQIYSYNHKWFITILLFVNFSMLKFTLPYLIFAIVFQIYSYFSTPDSLQGIVAKEEYFFDNLAFLFMSYIFLIILKKLYNIQKSRIDDQNTQLLGQQQELINSNQLLQKRSEQLLTSNQELERFAYIASHDLKTPLNNIISFSHLLERELKDFDNEKAYKYFHYIKNESNRMNTLIIDVLEYSKLSSEKIKNEETDLNQLIQMIVDSISEYINKKNAKVQIVNHLPIIKANNTKMYLLFKNLIENGIKYNESANPLVKIASVEKDDKLQFHIKDNGIGIAPKYHQSIFRMFFRLHNNHEYEGTGLGLALCKKILYSMGGNINIISDSRKGSQFIITLDKEHFVPISTT